MITAQRLMRIDSSVWRKLGFTSVWSSNPRNKTVSNSIPQYYRALNVALARAGIRRGSILRSIFRDLEDKNFHALNTFLETNGYYASSGTLAWGVG